MAVKVKEFFCLGKHDSNTLSRQDKIFSVKYYSLAFFCTLALGLLFFSMSEFAPFGERSLMAMDGWGQYFPMLREMKRAFKELNLGYSFSGALGFDLSAQSAYYTNSPLWFLLFLLPGELTPAQVDMLVVVKFALASLTMCYYLKQHFEKNTLGFVIISMFYGLSSYSLAFMNQFMWQDAVILLPLVLLGIERLYKDKDIFLYTVALFLTIFSCFYVAFAVCIFSVLWFFVITFTEDKISFKQWFIKALRFGVCSLTAGVLNLPVLIPLIQEIGRTKATDLGFNTEIGFYHSLKEIFINLMPFSKASLEYGVPNIYFGFFCLILCIFALFYSKVRLKHVIAYGSLFLFMLLSFNLNILDFIWHGFHFPNQLPGRQSFLFIFMGVLFASVGYYYISKQAGFKGKERLKKVVCFILVILMSLEITCTSFVRIVNEGRGTTMGSILKNNASINEVREIITPDTKNNEFWRTETVIPRYNGGQLYGYNGISQYSSTMSSACYDFFVKLGMTVYARNVSIEYHPNPVLNALFSVRYLLNEEKTGDEVSEFIKQADRLYLYENKAVLPLFYVGERDVLSLDMSVSGHEFTNEIFKSIAGVGDVIKTNGSIEKDEKTIDGYVLYKEEFLKGIENILESKCEITSFGKNSIKGTADAQKDGVLIISLPYYDAEIFIDGKKAETLNIAGYMAGAEITKGMHEIEIKF